MKKVKLGIPTGSLQEATSKVFQRAGLKLTIGERSYLPLIDDPEIEPLLLRAQEMSRYVEKGVLDCGITGEDWIQENNSRIIRVASLDYSKQTLSSVKWVLAVPRGSSIRKLKDLKGKRIATELVNVTKRFLQEKGIKAQVEFSWGATEIKARLGLVDAIVELTETGKSLRAHNLRPIAKVCESTTQFIANRSIWKDSWMKRKIEQIVILLKGAISAETMVGLKMNVFKNNLKRVLSLLPALKNPTISNLAESGWFAVETVIKEDVVRKLIPRLKEAGAKGIIEYPLNKVIY